MNVHRQMDGQACMCIVWFRCLWRLEEGMMSIECACISHPLRPACIGMESKGDAVKLIAGAGQHNSSSTTRRSEQGEQ